VGKTRLAIQAARRLTDDFEDGVFFISLAPITDAALITSAIADVLDVQEVSGVPLVRTLQAYLSDRRLLLVLDNFEHVVAAASTVADLLIVSPRLQVLVTSRAPLHLRGEHQLDVSPLQLPRLDSALEPDDQREAEAVRLFEERAQAVKADFAITRDNVDVVIEICRRLDGLPLALELAAARVKVLPPAAVLAHLDRRLPLLTGGAHDLPARQQTLRETIAWSYQLLEPSEQRLFRRVTVLVGGCTFLAVAAVCFSDSETQEYVLDQLAALVDKPAPAGGKRER
jgi:predicted ATPase